MTHPNKTSQPLSSLFQLGDRLLWGFLLSALLFLASYFSLQPWLPESLRNPGSPPLYLTGVVGAALLLLAFAFVLVKRTGRGGAPPSWLAAHVMGAILGTILVAVHSGGSLRHPPALLYLVLIALAVIGVWARTRLSRRMAGVFATRDGVFAPPDPVLRAQLSAIISRKEALLPRLAPGAREGTFSLTHVHWRRHPWLSLAFSRLTRRENRLVGAHSTLSLAHAYWRRVHIMLGLLFAAGLLAHVFTVTFFAGYVAGGREITWWHLTTW